MSDILNVESFKSFASGKDVKIGVIDTGFKKNDNVVGFKSFLANKETESLNPHGQNVIDIISRTSPDSEIYFAKALDEKGLGSARAWYDSLIWLSNQNIDIICMSLGSKKDLTLSMNQKIQNITDKKIAICAPCGNDRKNFCAYPARYPSVISVGAINEELRLTNFSNYGNDVDINGIGIFEDIKGTSFANAFVVGQLALIKSYKKDVDLNSFIEEYKKTNPVNKTIDMLVAKQILTSYP